MYKLLKFGLLITIAGFASAPLAFAQEQHAHDRKLMGSEGTLFTDLATYGEDLAEVNEKAQASGKFVLLEFHGRTWCQPCVDQKRNLLDTKEFQNWKARHVEMCDVPIGKEFSNNSGHKSWKELFDRFELKSIPMMVLLDVDGKLIGKLGPEPNAKAWITKAEAMVDEALVKDVVPVSSYVEKIASEYQIPGIALAIVHKGKVVHRQFYGYSNERQKIRADKDTVFGLFSLTKLFVSTAVFKLVEDGKLKLNMPLGEILDDLPMEWRQVQIRHLLSHSSGLPEIKDYSRSKETLAKELVYADKIKSEPGQLYDYNQTNFWLLKRVIESVSSQSFSDFLLTTQFGEHREKITICGDPSKQIPGRTQFYFPFAGKAPAQRFDYLDACNGLNLTLDESIAWNRKLDKGELISKSSKKQMWSSFDYKQPKKFAHGWDIHQAKDGSLSYGFSGSLVTAFRKFPDQEMTIIFLGNGFIKYFDVEDVVDELAQLVTVNLNLQK